MGKAEHVSELIRESILTGELAGKPMLPGARKLCEHFRVSRGTMAQALAILRDEGLIESRDRSGVFIKREKGAKPQRTPLPQAKSWKKAEKIAEDIESMISEGELGVGDFLPYQKSLCVTYRVSPKTIREALRILVGRGIVQQKGTTWIVGSKLLRKMVSKMRVIAYDHIPNTVHRGLDFFVGLEKELLKHGVPISLSRIAQTPGIRNSKDKIESTGTLGLAIFNMTMWIRSKTKMNLERLRKELYDLNKYGVPVVLNRAAPVQEDFPELSLRSYQNLYPLGPVNLNAGIETMVFLHAQGHRHIGFFSYVNQSWAAERFMAFRTAAKRVGEGRLTVSLFGANADPLKPTNPFRGDAEKSFRNFNAMTAHALNGYRFCRKIPAFRALGSMVAHISLDQHIDGMISVFNKALANEEITAWICADTSVAFAAYDFLQSKGVDVPERLSLVSLGDDELTAQFRITAYDPRIDRIGYLAAHCLLGDIPIKKDKNGFVECPGQIVDRGTVGRPL